MEAFVCTPVESSNGDQVLQYIIMMVYSNYTPSSVPPFPLRACTCMGVGTDLEAQLEMCLG